MKRLCFAVIVCVILLECSASGAASKTIRNNSVSSKPAITVYIEDVTEGKISVPMIQQKMYSELSKLGAFHMIDRRQVTSISDSNELHLGKIRAANFILIGTVTFSYCSTKPSGAAIPFLGVQTQANTAYVVLSIRVVDVETSSVVYASTHVGEAASKKTPRGKPNDLTAKAASNAVEKSISAMKKQKLSWLNTTPKSTSRPRIVLYNFLHKSDTEEIASFGLLSNLMITKLYEFGGFDLIEREHIDYIAHEINLAGSGLADEAASPAKGKIKAAQYMLTGAMTFVYSKKASDGVVPALGIAAKADTAYAMLEIRTAELSTASYVLRSAHIGWDTSKNRGITAHNGIADPVFWKAASSAMEEAVPEIEALARPDTPSQPKPTVTETKAPKPQQGANNIKSMFAKSSILDLPRVFVDDFEDKTEDRNTPIDSIMTMMITELHKAEIFSLIDRKKLHIIVDEIEQAEAGLVDPSTAVKRGKLWGFQYIITGAVTLRKYDEKGSGFMLPIIGSASKAKTAYVVLDIRIVDAETGSIIYADNQMGSAVNKEKRSIGSYESMIGGLLDMAARDAVKKHVSEMKTQASQI